MTLTIKHKKPPKPKPWKNHKRKAEAREKIRMLEGKGEHNNWSNICYGDGYFAQSIIRDFGQEAGASSISGIKKWTQTP